MEGVAASVVGVLAAGHDAGLHQFLDEQVKGRQQGEVPGAQAVRREPLITQTTQPVVGLSYQVLDAVDGGWPVVRDDLGQQRDEALTFKFGERAGEHVGAARDVTAGA